MYLWILFVIFDDCQAAIALPETSNSHIFKEILPQFAIHQIIFHYDMESQKNLDEFLVDRKSFLQSVFLMNHEIATSSDPLDFCKYCTYCVQKFSVVRPKGYYYFHVVYLTNYLQFEKFSMVRGNLNHYDVVLFVLENTKVNDISVKNWNLRGLEQAGTVIISDNKINFYFVQFYVGNLSGVPFKINAEIGGPNFRLYSNKFNDFNRHLFKIGHPVSNVSWFWCG